MALQNGEILNNRYRIVRQLGQGPRCLIYQAWDREMNIHRVIREYQLSSREEDIFQIQAQILENLSHPNLPKVLGHFILPDQEQYLIAEYIEGTNLQEMLDKQWDPLPEETVLPLIKQVCDVLSYLHAQTPPVMHNDIKPANILLTPYGKVMLVGLDILTSTEINSKLAPNQYQPTPGYTAPELQEDGSITQLTDTYALGATLYTLLTGNIPVESTQRTIRDPLLPASEVHPSVSTSVSEVITRAMHPEPTQRFQSVSEIKKALTTLPASQPGPEKPYSEGLELYRSESGKEDRLPLTRLFLKKWLPVLVGFVLIILLVTLFWPDEKTEQPANLTPTFAEAMTSDQGTPIAGDDNELIIDLTPILTLEPSPTSRPDTPATPTTSSGQEQPVALPQNVRPSLGTIITSTIDGMKIVYIPPGDFQMGSNLGDDDEKPVHTVTLDAYWMDQTEVTNQMYAQCVDAGYCGLPEEPWRLQYESLVDHPVVSVSWNKAKAYCEWAGRRLPTEAEWEKAAGWDPAARLNSRFPWGDEAEDCSRGNYMQVYSGEQGGNEIRHCVGNTTAVGTYPSGASYYGVLDMAGNAWEWVQDWYGYYYYSNSPPRNPPGAENGFNRVARGGSWDSSIYLITTTDRSSFSPDEEKYDLGFRCAQSAEAEAPQAADVTPTPIPELAATQISPIDKMALVFIPAGEFLMGSTGDDPDSNPDEYPQHNVYLDSYWMDQHEVTNAMYQQCVDSGSCEPSNATTTSSPDHPVLYVSWYQAQAYCSWAGRRLPTEAEWEKAARGGIEAAKYPWGNEEPVCDPGAINGAQYGPCDKSTLVVKTFTPNPYGLFDIAGNVWEWVSSFYLPYPYDARYGREDLEGDGNRTLRGGSWLEGAPFIRVASRHSDDPASWSYNIGFRCALTP